jgi:L-alanine-DL-glutamate epimerase-like enolase superfamily enzyme
MPTASGTDTAVTIARVSATAYRVPLERPLAASFGVLTARPAVFVRIEDRDGCFGFGEVFANWPAAGAEHRARLLVEDIAHLVLGRTFDSPGTVQQDLEARTRIRALQCGEPGPFRQCIAGLDQAAHDLAARRAGLPVARLLRADAPDRVPVYASGIHYDDAEELAPSIARDGIGSVKVKVGFGRERDLAGVARARTAFRDAQRLMLDANQAWTAEEAVTMGRALAVHRPFWLEEPVPADLPADTWKALAAALPIKLAGGENIAGHAGFAEATALGALRVVQPDLAKWGGFSGCLSVARSALADGLMFCPHFLGGGIGLHASAHLLASAGGDGLLEVDVNPNPLRDALLPAGTLAEGCFRLSDAPGLGIESLPGELERYVSLRTEAR